MKRSNGGFTLVEIMVAIAVTGFMITIISAFMMRSLQTSTMETNRMNLQREQQMTLDVVANDVRLSANADLNNRNPDANSPSGTTDQYSWTSNGSTLVLATAATTSNGSIIFTDPSKYITTKNNLVYFVSNKTLYRRTLAASTAGNAAKTTCPATEVTSTCPADKKLLNNVTTFSIKYLDGSDNSVTPTNARSVELSLTSAYTQYKQTQTVSYTTRMVFRND